MTTNRTGQRATQSLIILQTLIRPVLCRRQGWLICWIAHSGTEGWFPHLKDLSMHWFTRFFMVSKSIFLSPLNWRSLSPETSYVLVQQIFPTMLSLFFVYGLMLCLTIKLQFNCFLLMPIVDKLPALLRQDLESAFEDELDSIFDVTQLRQSLGRRNRVLEIEVKWARLFLF